MVRNKGQDQSGLNDNRLKNNDDNRQTNKAPNKGMEEETRESARKPGKSGQNLKGSPGKTHNRP